MNLHPHDVFCRRCQVSVGRGCVYPDGSELDPLFVHSIRVYDTLMLIEAEKLKKLAPVALEVDSESEPFFGGFTR